MPDTNPTQGQDPTPPFSQPGVSPAAQFYMSLRAEGPGGGAAPAAADAAGGQGGGDGGGTPEGGDGGFNWGLFPDVPQEQRGLLEPHLTKVQGHVTQLEQQMAPAKAVIDAGLSSEDVGNLVQLNQNFDRDPRGTWLALAENMQKAGVLDDGLDLQALALIAEGKDVPVGEGAPDNGNGQEEIPGWGRQILDRFEKEDQMRTAQQQQQFEKQQQAALDKAVEGMKAQLKEAGYPDGSLTDEMLIGTIIAHKGDADKALQGLTGVRESVLKGFSENGSNTSESKLNTPKGAPPTKKEATKGPRGEFAAARAGAAQFLEGRMGEGAE